MVRTLASRTPAVEVTLDGGLTLRLRPIRPSDREAMRRGFERLSETSRYRRFLSPMPRLPDDMLVRFTEIDHVDHVAWVALDPHRPLDDPGVAVARYIRHPAASQTADVAITVVDAYQGLGVGTLLMGLLAAIARSDGVHRFSSLVLRDNLPMRRLLTRLGARFSDEGDGVLAFDLDLREAYRHAATDPRCMRG